MPPLVESSPVAVSMLPPELQNSTAIPDSPLSEQHIPISTSSLDALQSDEQRQVLNIVDSLRQCGLEGIVSLPQLVVCGDQSSGKSSVLEAITEIPFPRKENLCTRFATEIVLRRAPTPSIRTRIIPKKTRPKQEQAELERFREFISDFRELPDLIDKATALMGIAEATDQMRKAFARDILSIEISGPDRPQLTLVDLPGLIHSENKTQSSADVQLVWDLVEGYISNPRTIILAIVSAKNDYANQIILKRAREFDKKGSRTLGTITKPDDIHPNSGNETAFINLAKKRRYLLRAWMACSQEQGLY
jgi:GTPase SAR1 family protein